MHRWSGEPVYIGFLMLEIFDGHPAPPCHRILLALHHSSKRRFDLVSLIVTALGFLVEGVPVDKL